MKSRENESPVPLKVVVEREFDSLCGNLRGFLQVKGIVKSPGESSGMGY